METMQNSSVEKSVNDRRRNDPPEWDCLNDLQRDAIFQWYLRQERYREKEKQQYKYSLEQEKKRHEKEERRIKDSGYFALIPFIIYMAHYFFADGIISSILGLLVSAFVIGGSYLFCSDYYMEFNYRKYDKEKDLPVGRVLVQCVVLAGLSYLVIRYLYRAM